MSEELKPCPFCGGKAVIEVIEPHRHINSSGAMEY